MIKIFIGSDHGGFYLKQELVQYLHSLQDVDLEDMGTHSEVSVDYPDIAKSVTEKVLNNAGSIGILMCGTGLGISIAANKVKGIRAALCAEPYSAKMAKAHNNANVLCMGGRVTGPELAKMIIDTFLSTSFEGGRHQVRIDKISALENL